MSQAIKRREKAIHAALRRYNTAALALMPPRPTLKFSELTEHTYLANFDFLKHSERGALDADWSRPVNRCCVAACQKIQRAKEEIDRLNVEICRVRTYIRDKEAFLSGHYERLRSSNPVLARTLLTCLELTIQANQRISQDLDSISALKGFTGQTNCGVHVKAELKAVATPPVSTSRPDKTGPDNSQSVLADALAALWLQCSAADLPESDMVEVEPSDKKQHKLVVIEETCKVM